MPRKLRLLLYAVGGLLLFFALLTAAANLILRSDTVKARLRQGTEAALGVPLEIGAVSFSLPSGVTLHDIRPAEGAAASPYGRFEARSLHIRFAWLPLLAKQFVITSIRLDEPVLIVPENQPVALLPPEGRVEVPLPEDTNASPLEEQPGTGSAAEPAPGIREEPAQAPRRKPPAFTLEVRSFSVRNGELQIRDRWGLRRVQVCGMNIESHLQPKGVITGRLSAHSAELPGLLLLRNITAPFHRAESKVNVEEFSADWAGGKIVGNGTFSEANRDFSAVASIEKVRIPQLLEDAGWGGGRTQGYLEGNVDVQGTDGGEEIEGRGEFFLREAKIEPVDFLRQVGRLLRIEELELLSLNEAHLRLQLQNRKLTVETLRLATENLVILSSGEIDPKNAELDLQSRLLVNPVLQRKLGDLVSRVFAESDEEGYRELTFRVHGPLARPQTDLLDRLGLGRIGAEVGRFLQNLLRSPAKEKSRGEN